MKILDDLMEGLADAPAHEVRVGRFWTAVWSRHCGLASTTGPGEYRHGARFVEGAVPLDAERAGSAPTLARIGRKLRDLHTRSRPFANSFNPFHQLDRYVAIMGGSSPAVSVYDENFDPIAATTSAANAGTQAMTTAA